MQEIFYWHWGDTHPDSEPFLTFLTGTTFGPNYRMERQHAQHYVFAYVQSGRGTLNYNGKMYPLSAGDAFILHKSSNHVYSSDNRDPFRFLWFNCIGNLIPVLLRLYGLDQQVLFQLYNKPALFEEFQEICRTHSDSQDIHSLCAIQFHRIVVSLADHLHSKDDNAQLPQKIKQYLDHHVNQPLSLKEMAEQLGYSPAHIGRCFKSVYGQTPYQYLLNEKLAAAKRLLSQTDVRVWQVANLLGFNDEFHFSNAFYRHFGYRPSVLRQENNQKDSI